MEDVQNIQTARGNVVDDQMRSRVMEAYGRADFCALTRNPGVLDQQIHVCGQAADVGFRLTY